MFPGYEMSTILKYKIFWSLKAFPAKYIDLLFT